MTNPKNESEGSSPQRSSNPSPEEVVKPFSDASMKFVQATISAQQASIKDYVQAQLDAQQAVRKAEQEAYDAVLDATRKHLSRMSEKASGNDQEIYSSRMQSQMDYESEVRQAYAKAQSKLQEIAQKAVAPKDGDHPVERLASLRQSAYQEYLADLQRAWSGTTTLDPNAVKAIAFNMLYALNAY